MRTPKYRAWDKERKEWQYFTLLQLAQGEASAIWSKLDHWCEFTGFLDKNNVEIFKWDIVKHKHPEKIGTVVFGQYLDQLGTHEGWYVKRIMKKIRLSKLETLPDFKVHEIIGNLYQTPELLSK